jgi:hypothetical protein
MTIVTCQKFLLNLAWFSKTEEGYKGLRNGVGVIWRFEPSLDRVQTCFSWNVRTLKAWNLFALTLFLTTGCAAPIESARDSSGGQGARENEWGSYQGAWFSIEYPRDLVARPSLAAEEHGSFDSVFFSTGDDGVSFYVLSPQWRRAASDAAFKPAQESRIEFTEQADDGLIKSSTLIRARDGSYERLIESFVSSDQTVNWIFQFIYSDDELKKQYAPLYKRFKTSLQQFAD